MDEFALVLLCFPEARLKDSILYATTKLILGNKMELSEFYIWLGCHFSWHVLRAPLTKECDDDQYQFDGEGEGSDIPSQQLYLPPTIQCHHYDNTIHNADV